MHNENNFVCGITLHFDSGHRVIGHSVICSSLHGHRYVLEISIESQKLDNLGMVIDFGLLKNIIRGWINENFDHTIILSTQDQKLGKAVQEITNQKIYYMPYNPTAENIAFHLKYDVLAELINISDLKVGRVKLYETPSCWVEV